VTLKPGRFSCIGVFDSGVGGLSILKALRAQLPTEAFVYLADAGYAPYGERGDAFVIERTRAVVRKLRDEHAHQGAGDRLQHRDGCGRPSCANRAP
jgi:glutamate racemase